MAKIPKPKATLGKNLEVTDASLTYDETEFSYDHEGYFLIRTVPERKRIEVGHCKQNNVILRLFKGNNARELCQAVLKAGIVSRLDHAAYLGRECEKAEAALKFGVQYVQDTDIQPKKKHKETNPRRHPQTTSSHVNRSI